MWRWSKIPETRPEIIFDVNDDKFYGLVVQNLYLFTFKRSQISHNFLFHPFAAHSKRSGNIYFPPSAWEGNYEHTFFKKVINQNIPCVVMHKVRNDWRPEINTIVCFMTGECNDVFLIHPDDLTEWNPDDA